MTDFYPKCAVCFEELHNPEKFPEDFPEKWKWCCSCLLYADDIVKNGDVEEIIKHWISIILVERKSRFVIKLRKIDKLIRVA